MEKRLDLYTDYLISSNGQVSATDLAKVLDNTHSHDSFTRMLSKSDFTSKDLWLTTKPIIRQFEQRNQNLNTPCLIFDDTISEKPYTDENDIVAWHFDHCQNRTIKGINLLTAFYSTSNQEEELRLPVSYEIIHKDLRYCDVKTKKEHRKSKVTKNELLQKMVLQAKENGLSFKYVLADTWFASSDNMRFIDKEKRYFVFDIKDNRSFILFTESPKSYPTKLKTSGLSWSSISSLQIEDGIAVKVWLKDLDLVVIITKQVFRNEAGELTGCRYLVSNDLSLSASELIGLYQKRWGIEEYHKSLKQNTSLCKSPTRTVKTQSNHLYCSIVAYVKLEVLKLQIHLGHFALKSRLYIKALKAAFAELQTIKLEAQSV
jgi:DDE superfamily endonuclease